MQALVRFASTRVLDGNAIARDVMDEVRADVEALKEQFGKTPGLAVLQVGARGDSSSYVKKKVEACRYCGIKSFERKFPNSVSESDVLDAVSGFNANPAVHGILMQLPLPKHIDQNKVLDHIVYDKDVDGFHPFNLGELCITTRNPRFVACTPRGCMELLKRGGVNLVGKKAVVVGRSQIVGIPAAMLLQRAGATVTICHSKTRNLAEEVGAADVVVAATGQANMIKGEWIKPGAAVVDVGINFVKDATKKTGLRMVGDVDYKAAKPRAGVITPVPGGVGPMTVAMLMRNTVDSARRFFTEEAAKEKQAQ